MTETRRREPNTQSCQHCLLRQGLHEGDRRIQLGISCQNWVARKAQGGEVWREGRRDLRQSVVLQVKLGNIRRICDPVRQGRQLVVRQLKCMDPGPREDLGHGAW